MPTQVLDAQGYPVGVRKTPPFVTLGGLAATSYTIYTLSTKASVTHARMPKLTLWNNSGAVAQILIGYTTAAAVWTQVLPILDAQNALTNIWTEDQLPQFFFNTALGAAIVLRTSVASAHQVSLEVVEW